MKGSAPTGFIAGPRMIRYELLGMSTAVCSAQELAVIHSILVSAGATTGMDRVLTSSSPTLRGPGHRVGWSTV